MAPAEQDEEADASALPPPADLFGTETMAELCVRQGRLPEAIAIYRRLLEGAVDDEKRRRWGDRVAALQQPGWAPPAAHTPARPGDGGPERTAGLAGPAGVARPTSTTGDAGRGRPTLAVTARREIVQRPQAVHRLPLVIREPVRAGQIVYAENNDLIVLGPVNPGAQLIADGNIHVYARLRGRAVAGAHGATQARIFCQKLEAELVGVDSAYLIADDIPAARFGGPAQIFLEAGKCVVVPL